MVACGLQRIEMNPGVADFAIANSNETLRLQPAAPSGSQRFVGKGKGPRVLGNL